MTPFEILMMEILVRPGVPVLIMDERRFGKPQGFDGERIVFAGVLTTVQVAASFCSAIEKARDTHLDEQKRTRALKASDVLRDNHLGRALQTAVIEATAKSKITFWASDGTYLRNENRQRETPVAVDLNNGQAIVGAELPVFQMLAGQIAESDTFVREAGELEVFIDRSRQNGLYDGSSDHFTRFDIYDRGAPALLNGKSIRLGASVRQRLYAVCETTRFFGDWLLLADVAAHLWGRNPTLVDRLRGEEIRSGIKVLGMWPGIALHGELINAVADVNQRTR